MLLISGSCRWRSLFISSSKTVAAVLDCHAPHWSCAAVLRAIHGKHNPPSPLRFVRRPSRLSGKCIYQEPPTWIIMASILPQVSERVTMQHQRPNTNPGRCPQQIAKTCAYTSPSSRPRLIPVSSAVMRAPSKRNRKLLVSTFVFWCVRHRVSAIHAAFELTGRNRRRGIPTLQ